MDSISKNKMEALENKLREYYKIDIRLIYDNEYNSSNESSIIEKLSEFGFIYCAFRSNDVVNISINGQILSNIYINVDVLDRFCIKSFDLLLKLHKQNIKLKMLGNINLAYHIDLDTMNKYIIKFIGFIDNKGSFPKIIKFNSNIKEITLNTLDSLDDLEEIILPYNCELHIKSIKYVLIKLINIEYISDIKFGSHIARINAGKEVTFYNLKHIIDLYNFIELRTVKFAESCTINTIDIRSWTLRSIILNSKIKKLNVIEVSNTHRLTIYTPLKELRVKDLLNHYIITFDENEKTKEIELHLNNVLNVYTVVIERIGVENEG